LNAEPLPGAILAATLAFGIAGWAAAWRLAIRARADRRAAVAAGEREVRSAEAGRRLSTAAGESIEAVRAELVNAVRTLAPSIDVVATFEEHDAALVCVAAFGTRVEFFAGMRFALDDDGALIVLALQRGYRLTARDVPAARPLHANDAFAVAIPLVLDAGRRCVMYVASPESAAGAYTEQIIRLVDGAAPAYRIARERADDRARAEYDGLTGLLTPRAFRAALSTTVERARFAPLGRVAVLFIDTDRFKSWNDSYGHASGDALLRELAQHLRAAATDPSDIVARNGGDEFCVVFAGAEKSSAIERAERLRASIADADFRGLHAPVAGGEEVMISASIGVACFPADAQSPEGLLEKADEAMYHSKKSGRNGVSFFGVDAALVRGDGASEKRSADRRQE
jgi:diguanylate cyclase (GGDEF)-like protein